MHISYNAGDDYTYIPITNIANKFYFQTIGYDILSIIQTAEAAKTFISNRQSVYDRIEDNLRNPLNENLDKVDDFDGLLNKDHSELSELNTNLNSAYRDVRYAIYEQLDRNDDLTEVYYQALAMTGRDFGPISAEDYTEHDGILTDAAQITSNEPNVSKETLVALIDCSRDSYIQLGNNDKENPYLQLDLRKKYQHVVLKYSRCNDKVALDAPASLHIYATNTPDDEKSWTDLGINGCSYDYENGQTGILSVELGVGYRYVRLAFDESSDVLAWSELHAYQRACQADVLGGNARLGFYETIKEAGKELEEEWATENTISKLQEDCDAVSVGVDNSLLFDYTNSAYLTLFSDKSLAVPEGIEAAVVVSNGSDIRNDYRYKVGSVIPACTGVLLKSGKGNSFYLGEGETTEHSPAENLLHGTLSDETTDVEGDNLYYKLAYDAETGTKIGFYWGAQGGAPFVNKAGKAFLAVPSAASHSLMGISLFDLDKGMTTGVSNAATENQNLIIYDINGRRVGATSLNGLQPGIYVVNGKKIYVK